MIPSDKPTLWRKHFPIETEKDTAHSRRGFITGLAAAGGAIACCQTLSKANDSSNEDAAEWIEHPTVTLEKKFNEIGNGEAILFHFPDHRSPCLFVRISDIEYVAFSQKCTHLACPVIPEVEQNKFHCPCHHGVFDLRTGEPLAGPPRSPLPPVRIELHDDGTIMATGYKESS